eukprot:g2605.t1
MIQAVAMIEGEEAARALRFGRRTNSEERTNPIKLAIDNIHWREDEMIEKRRLRPKNRRKKESISCPELSSISQEDDKCDERIERSSADNEEEEERLASSGDDEAEETDTTDNILELLESIAKKTSLRGKKSSRSSILLRKGCYVEKKRMTLAREAHLAGSCPVSSCEKFVRDLPSLVRYKPVGDRASQRLGIQAVKSVLGEGQSHKTVVIPTMSASARVYRSWKMMTSASPSISKHDEIGGGERHQPFAPAASTSPGPSFDPVKRVQHLELLRRQRGTCRKAIVKHNEGFDRSRRHDFAGLSTGLSLLLRMKEAKGTSTATTRRGSSLRGHRTHRTAIALRGKLDKLESSIDRDAKEKEKRRLVRQRKLEHERARRWTRLSGRRKTTAATTTVNVASTESMRKRSGTIATSRIACPKRPSYGTTLNEPSSMPSNATKISGSSSTASTSTISGSSSGSSSIGRSISSRAAIGGGRRPSKRRSLERPGRHFRKSFVRTNGMGTGGPSAEEALRYIREATERSERGLGVYRGVMEGISKRRF